MAEQQTLTTQNLTPAVPIVQAEAPIPESNFTFINSIKSLGGEAIEAASKAGRAVVNAGRTGLRYVALATVPVTGALAGEAMAAPETASDGHMQSINNKVVYKQTPGFKFKLLGPAAITQSQQGEAVKFKVVERNNTSKTARKVVTDIFWQEKPGTAPQEKQFTQTIGSDQTKSKTIEIVAPADPHSTWSSKDNFDIRYMVAQDTFVHHRYGRTLYNAMYKVGYLNK